jgi:hypothetical protein
LHSFDVFRTYEKTQWQLRDIPWDEIRPELVRPEYITLAKSAVMGECNSIAAVHGFLNEFVDDYDFSAFVCLWGFQELQHHCVFRSWLGHLGIEMDARPVEATRAPYPPGNTRASTLATNVISELTVNSVYRSLSGRVEEPVLKNILLRASQDEARHAREFLHYARRRLEEAPDELPSLLETLYVYTADMERRVKHPVSIFKEGAPEFAGLETIDDGFAYFQSSGDGDELLQLRDKIFRAFTNLTGTRLERPRDVRRALAEALTVSETGAKGHA